MAALRAILKALRRAVNRDLMTLWSIKVNNFFLFVLLLVYGALESGVEPKGAEPFLLLLGLLALFPASSDPLAKIPASRYGLWPLRAAQRAALRLGSLALSPVLWITAFLLWKTSRPSAALGFLAFAVSLQIVLAAGAGLARVLPAWNPLRYIPQAPGRLGGLIRNNLREMATVLDCYVALLLSVGGICHRFLAKTPDPAAFPILSILIALAWSTYAQSLFGLELGSAITRYRLLPLKGWEILLAKDVAFLLALLLMIGPVSVGPGLSFGLWALAVGHHSSIFQQIPLKKWRFSGGRLLPVGALQALGGVTVGFGEISHGLWILIPVSAVCLASLVLYGRILRLDNSR